MSIPTQFAALVKAQTVQWLEQNSDILAFWIQELAVQISPKIAECVQDNLRKLAEYPDMLAKAPVAREALENCLKWFDGFDLQGGIAFADQLTPQQMMNQCKLGLAQLDEIPF